MIGFEPEGEIIMTEGVTTGLNSNVMISPLSLPVTLKLERLEELFRSVEPDKFRTGIMPAGKAKVPISPALEIFWSATIAELQLRVHLLADDSSVFAGKGARTFTHGY